MKNENIEKLKKLRNRVAAYGLSLTILGSPLFLSGCSKEDEPVILEDPVVEPVDNETITYVVKYGDKLENIASRFNTTVSDIIKLNDGIISEDLIYEGQKIVIPYKSLNTTSYTVKMGDKLENIANENGVTINDLLYCNPDICDENLIYADQVIDIPETSEKKLIK